MENSNLSPSGAKHGALSLHLEIVSSSSVHLKSNGSQGGTYQLIKSAKKLLIWNVRVRPPTSISFEAIYICFVNSELQICWISSISMKRTFPGTYIPSFSLDLYGYIRHHRPPFLPWFSLSVPRTLVVNYYPLSLTNNLDRRNLWRSSI